MDDRRLKGKVALVSGGATGIGAAVVKRLTDEGAHVGLGDIDTEAGQSVVDAVSNSGGSSQFFSLDVQRASHWESAVTALFDLKGRLDILVNNAGIYIRTP